MRTALCLLIAAAAGCAGVRRSEDPLARDQEITRDVHWRLLGDARFEQVLVSCKDGVVALDGTVTDESDKAEAERMARRVASVREVRSNLRVRVRSR
jgi:osmotically-inducible protein OsmY